MYRIGLILGPAIFLGAVVDWILLLTHYAELIEKTLPWTQRLVNPVGIFVAIIVGILIFLAAWAERRKEKSAERERKTSLPAQNTAPESIGHINQHANPINTVDASQKVEIHNHPPVYFSTGLSQPNAEEPDRRNPATGAAKAAMRSEEPRQHYLNIGDSDFGDCLEEASNGRGPKAFFAVFHNSPVTAKPTEAEEILARISFYHRGNVLENPKVVDSGCWFNESDRRVSIYVGDTEEVCIAATAESGECFAIGNKRLRLDDGAVVPRPATAFALEQREYDVEVKLIYGYEGAFVDAFWFEFITGPNAQLKRQNEPSWDRAARRR